MISSGTPNEVPEPEPAPIKPMNPWMRGLHLLMLVGGGFTGLTLTLTLASSPQVSNDAGRGIVAFAVSVYLFCIIAGILVSQHPRNMPYALVAYIVQIPWFVTPLVGYRFCAGAGLNLYAVDDSIGFQWQFGATWEITALRGDHWGIGFNLVALIMALVVARALMRPKWEANRQAAVRQAEDPNEPKHEPEA